MWPFDRKPKITQEILDIAKRQVAQQEELDKLSIRVGVVFAGIQEARQSLLARTARIQQLEINVGLMRNDVGMLGTALDDLLADLLPYRDARIERIEQASKTLLARIETVEESLDLLEEKKEKRNARRNSRIETTD